MLITQHLPKLTTIKFYLESPSFPWISKVESLASQALNKARNYWYDSTPHDKEISDIALLTKEELFKEWDAKSDQVKAALSYMVDQQKCSHKGLCKDLKTIFGNLPNDKIKAFLDDMALKGLEEGKAALATLSLKFLEKGQLFQILKQKQQDLKSAKDVAESIAKNLPKSDNTSVAKEAIGRTTTVIFNFLPNLANTFLRAFTFFDMGREPDTTWEANAFLEIYYKCFMIPVLVFLAFKTLFVPAWPAYLMTGIVIALAVGSLFIYLQWLRPCPNHLPYCKNLNLSAKMGELSEVSGRSAELNKLSAYLTNSSTNVKHPILVAPAGAGKTKLVELLAKKIEADEIPLLRGKKYKVFSLNTAELSSGHDGFAAKLDRILRRINGYEEEVILFLDEIHEVAKNPSLANFLKSLLSETGKKRIKFIGATTQEGYQEILNLEKADSKEKKEEKSKNDTNLPPFADRFEEIKLEDMSDEDKMSVLLNHIRLAARNVTFENPGGIVKTIVDKKLSMRKSVALLNDAIQQVQLSLIQNSKASAIDVKKDQVEALRICYEQSDGNMRSEIDKEIEGIEREIKELQIQLEKDSLSIDQIKKLLADQRRWKEEYNNLAKKISQGAQGDENAFFFFHHMGIHQMEQEIEKRIKNTHLKLRVDVALIKSLNP